MSTLYRWTFSATEGVDEHQHTLTITVTDEWRQDAESTARCITYAKPVLMSCEEIPRRRSFPWFAVGFMLTMLALAIWGWSSLL